ncbi:hypothetical protein ACFXTI_004657 [Malus domestica]
MELKMLQEFKLVDSVKSEIGSEILRKHHRLHCSSDQLYKELAVELYDKHGGTGHCVGAALNVHEGPQASTSGGNFVGLDRSPEEANAINDIDPQAEDKELKVQLSHKCSGYLGTLKQEFMKKKKNGKLPKEAWHQLLDWWCRHYKSPYPLEAQKLALAESTGLELKQINNWFINQRKRHWKPSEDMQFVLMDPTLHQHHHYPHFCMDNAICNPFSMDCTSTLL